MVDDPNLHRLFICFAVANFNIVYVQSVHNMVIISLT